MKQIITSLVTTNTGWITRFVLKYVAIGGASLSAFLASKGVADEQTTAIVAGVTAAIAAALEQGLSWVARKYAVK